MQIHELSERTQDYLKVVWDLSEHSGGGAVPLKDVAGRLGQKASTASEAIKRMAAQGLIEHERYAGVSLTDAGRRLAIAMVRRHRLLETFLVTSLGYTWDEVHEDADLLEHACTDRFIERLDALLGHPARDPHGDPIPDAAGTIADLGVLTLADAAVGQAVILERVCDGDPELLRYLDKHGVGVGDVLVVEDEGAGLLAVQVGEKRISLAAAVAGDLTVSLA